MLAFEYNYNGETILVKDMTSAEVMSVKKRNASRGIGEFQYSCGGRLYKSRWEGQRYVDTFLCNGCEF